MMPRAASYRHSLDGLEKNCGDCDLRTAELTALEATVTAQLRAMEGKHKAVAEERRKARLQVNALHDRVKVRPSVIGSAISSTGHDRNDNEENE